jgi:hypothetical protein
MDDFRSNGTLTQPRAEKAEVRRFGFVLLPEFPLHALVPAMEAPRIADQWSQIMVSLPGGRDPRTPSGPTVGWGRLPAA